MLSVLQLVIEYLEQSDCVEHVEPVFEIHLLAVAHQRHVDSDSQAVAVVMRHWLCAGQPLLAGTHLIELGQKVQVESELHAEAVTELHAP